MYIGEVAKQTGATRKAIRLYESLGLIPAPERKGTYRVYSDKHVALIGMIRRAQSVGFTLAELKDIVAAKAESNLFPIDMANELIARKRETLRNEISRIMSLDQRLIELHEELNRTFS